MLFLVQIEKWYKTAFNKTPPFVIFEYCKSGVIIPTLLGAITQKLNGILSETQSKNYLIGVTGRSPSIKEKKLYKKGKNKTMFLLYKSANKHAILNLERYYAGIKGSQHVPAEFDLFENINQISGYYYLYVLVETE